MSTSEQIERIDRAVFLRLWHGSLREAAFGRVLYRDAYPHWPEMSAKAVAPVLRNKQRASE